MRFLLRAVRLLLPIFLCVLGSTSICAQEFLVGNGGGASANDYAWTGCCTHLAVGEPGVLFATMKKPTNERDFMYVILLKHQETKASSSTEEEVSGNDAALRTKGTLILELGGKKLTVVHALEMDTTTGTMKSEMFSINDKPVDFAKGRVILLDLTSDTITWKQVKAKLPTKLPDQEKTDGVRETAKRVRTELPADSKEVQEFLK